MEEILKPYRIVRQSVPANKWEADSWHSSRFNQNTWRIVSNCAICIKSLSQILRIVLFIFIMV